MSASGKAEVGSVRTILLGFRLAREFAMRRNLTALNGNLGSLIVMGSGLSALDMSTAHLSRWRRQACCCLAVFGGRDDAPSQLSSGLDDAVIGTTQRTTLAIAVLGRRTTKQGTLQLGAAWCARAAVLRRSLSVAVAESLLRSVSCSAACR